MIRVQNYRSFRCTVDRQRANGGNSCISVPYQNNRGVGSNKCAFNASNSFSNRRDSSKISGLRKVKYRRCVCRTCATNRTYSAACSGVIFAKFSICGHFVPSWYNLSIFLFACLYGLGNGLFRGPSSFLGRLCYFGCFPCDFRGFLFYFRPIVCAIHEILYDSAPEIVALRTLFRTNLAPGVMRANGRYDNKDSFGHPKTIFCIPVPANLPLPISVH